MTEEKNWKDFTYQEKVLYLMNPKYKPDCSFLVGKDKQTQKTFHCSKWILSCVSPVFEKMFNGSFVESKSDDPVRLDDVEANSFKKFIDVILYDRIKDIYSYPIPVSLEVTYLCKKYCIQKLLNECLTCIYSNITTLNMSDLISLWKFTKENGRHDYIKLVENEIRKPRAEPITNSNIFDLDALSFLEIIKLLNDKIPEIEKYNCIVAYLKINIIQNNDKNKSKDADIDQIGTEESDKILENPLFGFAMGLIDFKKIKPREFVNGPGQSKFFSDTEKYHLLQSIVKHWVN